MWKRGQQEAKRPDGVPAGQLGERLAARFLRKAGYTILRRNCRSYLGEIDLVARDGEEVVFVEVKTRTSSAWGDPEAAVTPAKQRKICRAALSFAGRNKLRERPLRFDVVAVLLEDPRKPQFTHYKDAFLLPTSFRV